MNLKTVFTNNKFKRLLKLHKKISDRVKSSDSSLLNEPDVIKLKEKNSIKYQSGESLPLVLFPILIAVSYIMLVTVLYGFYFDSDISRFQRSADVFIISAISVLVMYIYKGNLLSLKLLNVLNTLSIVFAVFIMMLNYFSYYMHHEWYLLTIVFFNFFTNRVIINSGYFSQVMKEVLWDKVNNSLLKRKLDESIRMEEVEYNSDNGKVKPLKIILECCFLNKNIKSTFKESNELNQRVESNDVSLLREKRLIKYNELLCFDVDKKTLVISLLSMILLTKAYVMTAFILLSSLDNKNDLPLLFFIITLVLIFSMFSVLLTHKGVVFGFKMLITARYLFIILFSMLVGLKFLVGIIEYKNISLYIIAADFLLAFFMLNTHHYNRYLRELHYFLAWHKIIRKL